MADHWTNPARPAGLDRHRDLEIFGLLKPGEAESADGDNLLRGEEFHRVDPPGRTGPDLLPHWI